MYTGLLHLHNAMRWVILILLLVAIFQHISAGKTKPTSGQQKTSLFLLISAHITLLIGLYQYFTGSVGFQTWQAHPVSDIMGNTALRFWAVEHITGMLIAIILITIARGVYRKDMDYSAMHKRLLWLYLIAVVLIMAAVPWPFRTEIARPLFPGM